MPIDVDSLEDFVNLLEAFALRTENGDVVPVLTKSARFLPDTSVKRNRKVLDDNQNASFCFCHVVESESLSHKGELLRLRTSLLRDSNEIHETLTIAKS